MRDSSLLEDIIPRVVVRASIVQRKIDVRVYARKAAFLYSFVSRACWPALVVSLHSRLAFLYLALRPCATVCIMLYPVGPRALYLVRVYYGVRLRMRTCMLQSTRLEHTSLACRVI